MSPQNIISNWIKSAKEDCQAAGAMYSSGHYHWALFLWHLVIEKVLKGILVKKGIVPPPIHDLEKLATLAQLPISDKEIHALKEITTYNIEARYDDYKRKFYKKATKAYTSKWIKICEEIYLWLIQHQ